MGPIRNRQKKLSLVLATLWLLVSALVSAHYHADLKTTQRDSSCSICQISHNFSKGLSHSGSISVNPHCFFENFPSPHFFQIPAEPISSALIRGPPAHPLA